MHLCKKRLKIIPFLATLLILSGCKESVSNNPNKITSNTLADASIPIVKPDSTTDHAQIPANKLSIQQGQIVDSNGLGIEGTIVHISDQTTVTDINGYYSLNNLVANKKTVVSIKPKNGPAQSTIISVEKYSKSTTRLSPNYLKYTVDTYENTWESESQEGIDGSHIIIPASGYLDAEGNIYNGTVTHELSFEDIWTEKIRDTFPGTYSGINSNGVNIAFISYGLMSIDLSSKNGNPLTLSDGMSIIFYSAKNETDKTIPLWHYDYTKGIWQEKSIAYRQKNGTYKGHILHAGTWSLSKAVEEELGTYRGRIVYTNGKPVKDARVYLVGKNWIKKDLSTNAQGIFEIEVVPGEEFRFRAYNYKWKYGAIYSNTLPAVKSGEVIENRI